MREQGWNPLLKTYPFSEKINAVSLGAEVLFCRLIAQADDFGNFYADPRMILATLFPHRWAKKEVTETDAGRWRTELVTNPAGPLVAIYSVGGVEYLHVIAPRRRFRSDVEPDQRFPREPENIEEDARRAFETRASRRRPADVPLAGTLDPDPDPDPDQEETMSPSSEELPEEEAEDLAREILEYISSRRCEAIKGSRRFNPIDSNLKPIAARVRERGVSGIRDGSMFDDARLVVDYKIEEWARDPKWRAYLTPTTLFRPSHFENYLVAASEWSAAGRGPIRESKDDPLALQKAEGHDPAIYERWANRRGRPEGEEDHGDQ